MLFGSLLVFSTLRGWVGTDTYSYEVIADEHIRHIGTLKWEPLFGLLFYGLADLSQNAALAIRGVSLLISLLFFAYFWRASKDERFVFMAYLIPVFYFTYTMNILRVGLGCALVLYAVRGLSQHSKPRFLVYSALAVLSHYSHLISVAYLYIMTRKIHFKWYLLALAALAVGGAIGYQLNAAYVLSKLELYSSFAAPSLFSGAPKLLACFLLIFATLTSCLDKDIKFRFAALSLLISCIAYSLVFVSYAGLRFLDLLSFLIPLGLLTLHQQEGKSLNASSKCLIVVAALLSIVFLYRSFLVEDAQSMSPFLPYHLIFQTP